MLQKNVIGFGEFRDLRKCEFQKFEREYVKQNYFGLNEVFIHLLEILPLSQV